MSVILVWNPGGVCEDKGYMKSVLGNCLRTADLKKP